MTAEEQTLGLDHVVPNRLGLGRLRNEEGLWTRATLRVTKAFNKAFPPDGTKSNIGEDLPELSWSTRTVSDARPNRG